MTNTYTAPKKKSPAGKITAIVLAVALIGAGIGAGIWFFTHRAGPLVKVTKAVQRTIDAAEKAEIVTTSRDVLDGGGLEIKAPLSEITKSVAGVAIDANVGVDMSFDLDNRRTAGEVRGSLGGVELAQLDFDLSGREAALRSDVLFGKNAYGVEFGKVRGEFRNSALCAALNLDEYGIDPATVEDFADSLVSASQGMTKEEKKAYAEKFLLRFADLLQKNAEITEEQAVEAVGGSDVDVNRVSVKLDGAGFNTVCSGVRSMINNEVIPDTDRVLEELSGYLKTFDESLGSPAGIRARLDEIAAEIEKAEADGELDDFTLTLGFSIAKKGGQLVGVRFENTVRGERYEGRLSGGPDWADPEEITVKFEENHPDGRVGRSQADYIVKENTDARYAARLTVTADGEEMLYGEIDLSRKTGEFTLSLSADGERFAVRGTLEKGDKDVRIKLDSATVANDVYPLGGISLRLVRDTSMPAPISPYQDAMRLSEDEINTLTAGIGDFTDDVSGQITQMILFSALSGLFGGN